MTPDLNGPDVPASVRWYAEYEREWKLFPVTREKLPAITSGFYRGSDNPDTVLRHLARVPGGGLAVVTGRALGAFVLDADNADAIAEVQRRGVPLTPRAKTSRGMHWYFATPKGSELVVRNRAGLLPKIDVRGDGGYVRIPPFFGLRWEVSPADMPFAPAPEWLLHELKRPRHHDTPEIGAVEDGHQFKGGDPASPLSWEKIA